MDLSGLDASPAEVGDLLDALAEVDEDGGAYDPDQAAADQINDLSDAEFAEYLASFEADQALPGPQLAGPDVAGTVDLANDISQIDAMLASMTDKEHLRQQQDQAESGRRGSTEIRLANAMRRIGGQTYLYGQADLANDPGGLDTWAEIMSTGPALNAAEVADQMRYQLRLGARPQGRGQFRPPVADLARQIGLR